MELLQHAWREIAQFFLRNTSTLLCIFTLFIYMRFIMKKRPKNFPPGPIGFPIVGAALSVGRRPEKTFNNWRKKYGDIIGLKIGSEYTVVLNNYELIQEALVKNPMDFNHRPNNYIMTNILHKSGIVMSDYTENYIEERKFTHNSLSRLGFGKNSMETAVIEEARKFVEYLGTTDGRWTEESKTHLMMSAGNIMCRVIMGRTYGYRDPEFIELCQGILNFFSKGSTAYRMTLLLPWSHHFPPVRGSANAMIKGFVSVYRIFDEKIDEHEATLDPNNIRDYMDEYLIQMKAHENDKSGVFSRKMLKCSGRDFFGAAMETIQVTILYLTLALANRPHIQEKVHEEIDQVLGDEGIPRLALRDKMPYCMAVIKETLRWRAPTPLSVAHCTAKDTVLNGYNIPKGTTILPNLYAVHNDPDIWENPSEFIPERHLDQNGKLIASKYFIPFGMGPRTCLGRRLAEVEAFVIPISILQKFKCVPTPTATCKRPWVKEDSEETGLTLKPPQHVAVTLVRR